MYICANTYIPKQPRCQLYYAKRTPISESCSALLCGRSHVNLIVEPRQPAVRRGGSHVRLDPPSAAEGSQEAGGPLHRVPLPLPLHRRRRGPEESRLLLHRVRIQATGPGDLGRFAGFYRCGSSCDRNFMELLSLVSCIRCDLSSSGLSLRIHNGLCHHKICFIGQWSMPFGCVFILLVIRVNLVSSLALYILL